jgi:hypothetical protein
VKCFAILNDRLTAWPTIAKQIVQRRDDFVDISIARHYEMKSAQTQQLQ